MFKPSEGDRKKILKAGVFLLFSVNIFLTLYGSAQLLSSPYTGLRTALHDGRAVVTRVVPGSPADRAGLLQGDRIIDLNGLGLDPLVFTLDMDNIETREGRRIFWREQERIGRELSVNKPVRIAFERDNSAAFATLAAGRFPAARAFQRLWPYYLVAWTFMLAALLVLRKSANEITIVNFLIGSAFCMASATGGTAYARDLSYPVQALRLLAVFNHIGVMAAGATILHFAFVFPHRRRPLDGRPLTIPAFYGALVVLVILTVAPVMDNKHAITSFPVLCAALAAVMLVHSVAREKNPLHRKQAQWVVSGFAVCILWALAAMYPAMLFGKTMPLEDLVLLPMLAIPFGMTAAVTRYRLMDIDDLFDAAVVYGVTIAVLEGAELAFFTAAAPLREQAGLSLAATSVLGVLVIVFLYMPVRNMVRRGVEAVFKRGTYSVEEELQKFSLSLGQCGDRRPLEKFGDMAKRLLGASGVRMLPAGAGAPGDRQWGLEQGLDGATMADYFSRSRASAFGYELADRGVLSGLSPGALLESALFVPFHAGEATTAIAAVLPKWNRTVYTHKDRAFLDAVSLGVSHVLEAEERRRMMERERLRLARDIHDGVSSEFSGILAFGEEGEQAAETGADPGRVKKLFSGITAASYRGMQELRNILWALDPERQAAPHFAARIRRHASDLLFAADVEVRMNDGDGQDAVMLAPHVSLAAFRTVQELCHNTLKHAGAERVDIGLSCRAGQLLLEYRDNGRGFDVKRCMESEGSGLKNMTKRAQESGGVFELSSAPGTGMRARLRLPLD